MELGLLQGQGDLLQLVLSLDCSSALDRDSKGCGCIKCSNCSPRLRHSTCGTTVSGSASCLLGPHSIGQAQGSTNQGPLSVSKGLSVFVRGPAVLLGMRGGDPYSIYTGGQGDLGINVEI